MKRLYLFLLSGCLCARIINADQQTAYAEQEAYTAAWLDIQDPNDELAFVNEPIHKSEDLLHDDEGWTEVSTTVKTKGKGKKYHVTQQPKKAAPKKTIKEQPKKEQAQVKTEAQKVADNKQKMAEFYTGLSGFDTICAGDLECIKKAGGDSTFGEITYDSVQDLIEKLKAAGKLNKNSNFTDMGSGIGKVVMQFQMNSPVAHAQGGELSKDRHDRAQKAFKRYKASGLYNSSRPMVLLNTDMLKMKLVKPKKGGFNIVFTCSTCFDRNLMYEIMKWAAQQMVVSSVLLTLKALPEDYADYGFEKVTVYKEPMTWMPTGSDVYHYELRKKVKLKKEKKVKAPAFN